MRTRLLHLWEFITTSFWFVPSLMSLVAVALAFLLGYVDQKIVGPQDRMGWLYAGGPDGAKILLSTVAGAVATIAGVAFSITIATISQASTQFGPRLLRNFMRDTGNQIVLGTFVSTFLYCLLVLRTVHGQSSDSRSYVPHASTTAAVLLAAASMAVLIYFIHHVATSLQAPAIVAASAKDLERVIARLAEEETGTGVGIDPARQHNGLPPTFDTDSRPVAAEREGYVQAVDFDELIKLADTKDLVIRLEYRPGDHLIECSTLAHVWPGERCDRELAKAVNATFMCGRRSTPEQDVEYAVRQLVEIAVRALSPGVNDPFTAINCIDALGSGLCRVSRNGLPGPRRYDRAGNLRVVTPVTTFHGITDAAFNMIRQYGRSSAAVTIRLLEVLTACARQVSDEEQRRALLRQAEMVYQDSEQAIPQSRDRQDIRERWEAAVQALGLELDHDNNGAPQEGAAAADSLRSSTRA